MEAPQVYKQQMSKNAVDGEKATRYFNAVLRHRQGELFGIDNMFAVRDPGKSCLTDGILKRKEAVEQVRHMNINIKLQGWADTLVRLALF